jgi:ketosteroid isomerase-like protein
MKSIVLTGMMITFVMAGQTAIAQGQPENALHEAFAARMKALESGDAEGWGKYTTDDFIVVQPDGTERTKAQRMSEIKVTPSRSSADTEQKWRTYGPNTAISTALATIEGKPTRVTSVWVKQGGMWKVASVQLTTVTAAK